MGQLDRGILLFATGGAAQPNGERVNSRLMGVLCLVSNVCRKGGSVLTISERPTSYDGTIEHADTAKHTSATTAGSAERPSTDTFHAYISTATGSTVCTECFHPTTLIGATAISQRFGILPTVRPTAVESTTFPTTVVGPATTSAIAPIYSSTTTTTKSAAAAATQSNAISGPSATRHATYTTRSNRLREPEKRSNYPRNGSELRCQSPTQL